MKAFLALVAIYVAAFLVATQGATQNAVEASSNGQGPATEVRIDAGKRADIRSLMEVVGARDEMRQATARQTEEFRDNLVSALPSQQRDQVVTTLVSDYQKKFHSEALSEQIVAIYDKHFTDDEVKGLLQFYSSPLGRKFAAEMPKIAAEAQAANREEGTRTATEVVQQLPEQKSAAPVEASLRPANPMHEQSRRQQNLTQPETLASASQP
jgi:uncharacterized protein